MSSFLFFYFVNNYIGYKQFCYFGKSFQLITPAQKIIRRPFASNRVRVKNNLFCAYSHLFTLTSPLISFGNKVSRNRASSRNCEALLSIVLNIGSLHSLNLLIVLLSGIVTRKFFISSTFRFCCAAPLVRLLSASLFDNK